MALLTFLAVLSVCQPFTIGWFVQSLMSQGKIYYPTISWLAWMSISSRRLFAVSMSQNGHKEKGKTFSRRS